MRSHPSIEPPPAGAPPIGRTRLVVATVLALVYAAPLLWPPAPVPPGTVTAADASLLARILPGVPPAWTALRLLALAGAAVLLAGAWPPGLPDPFRVRRETAPAPLALRLLAAAVAVLHAASAWRAGALGPAGQAAYLAILFVPAVLLALRNVATSRGASAWRRAVPVGAVVSVWTIWRLLTDLGSPRVADVVDGWLGFIASRHFATEPSNVLTDVYHPHLAGVGGVIAAIHGALAARLGAFELTFADVQVVQICWIAASAVGLAALANALIGAGAALIAVTVFLFAPYTRFIALFPAPFLVGPLYAIAIALLTIRVCRARSEAALAALGAAAGLGMTYPAVLPAVAFFGLVTAWHVAPRVHRLWAGTLAGLASFAATVVPLIPNVLAPDRVVAHFRWEGASALNDAVLVGQISLRAYDPLVGEVIARPVDIVVAALLSPFAHPRLAIRLWGDAIFDPLGGVLIAMGLAACLVACRRSSAARFLLAFFVVALSPAFVSPFEVVDITHALVAPVPVALLGGLGFVVAANAAGWSDRGRARAAAVATIAIAAGGTLLFDVVAPRTITASSTGIMFESVEPPALDRVVLVDYDPAVIPKATQLYQDTIARWGGARPVDLLVYGGGRFPRRDLLAEGKDLVFWSYALDRDYAVGDAVCRRWPHATIYEIADVGLLGRTYAARIGDTAWAPRVDPSRWTTWDCAAERARPREPLP